MSSSRDSSVQEADKATGAAVTQSAVTLADLDAPKLDTLLAWNVAQRTKLRELVAAAIPAIDRHTLRIEQLLDARAALEVQA